MTSAFAQFDLNDSLAQSLARLKFETPTEIQMLAIPPALQGRDIIACAQTGSGKTAAFALPVLARLTRDPSSRALVLAPTRELAQQIADVFRELAPLPDGARIAVLIGGTSMMPQLRNLKKNPRVVVGTPGRILDHLERGSLRLDTARTLVLDECDRMLDMGFAEQLNKIMRALPKERQTLLFSATFPAAAEKMIIAEMKNPLRLGASQISQVPARIAQTVVEVSGQHKNTAMLGEIQRREGSMIVFARTKSRTDRLARFLVQSGFKVNLIHGDRSQRQRQSALDEFKRGEVRILVATDIAARGIDVPQIRHVVNYDLPQCPEDFIHRIGRTGRAGAEGQSVSFVTPEDRDTWQCIERLLQGLPGGFETGLAAPYAPRVANSNKSSEKSKSIWGPQAKSRRGRFPPAARGSRPR